MVYPRSADRQKSCTQLGPRSYHPYNTKDATVNRADAQDDRCNGGGADDTADGNGGFPAGGYADGVSFADP